MRNRGVTAVLVVVYTVLLALAVYWAWEIFQTN
jgi:hypothetical protein